MKLYRNKQIRKVLNAYMQSVKLFDTQQVYFCTPFDKYILTSLGKAEYAQWYNGTIMVYGDFSQMKLDEFDEIDQNKIVRFLIKCMHMDIEAIVQYEKKHS